MAAKRCFSSGQAGVALVSPAKGLVSSGQAGKGRCPPGASASRHSRLSQDSATLVSPAKGLVSSGRAGKGRCPPGASASRHSRPSQDSATLVSPAKGPSSPVKGLSTGIAGSTQRVIFSKSFSESASAWREGAQGEAAKFAVASEAAAGSMSMARILKCGWVPDGFPGASADIPCDLMRSARRWATISAITPVPVPMSSRRCWGSSGRVSAAPRRTASVPTFCAASSFRTSKCLNLKTTI